MSRHRFFLYGHFFFYEFVVRLIHTVGFGRIRNISIQDPRRRTQLFFCSNIKLGGRELEFCVQVLRWGKLVIFRLIGHQFMFDDLMSMRMMFRLISCYFWVKFASFSHWLIIDHRVVEWHLKLGGDDVLFDNAILVSFNSVSARSQSNTQKKWSHLIKSVLNVKKSFIWHQNMKMEYKEYQYKNLQKR